MTLSCITIAGRQLLRYVLPVLSAIWLLWTMLETKRMQGWFEAQDSLQHASTPFFTFPTAEFAVAAICVLASFVSAALSRPRLGIVVALTTIAFIQMMWMGLTG